MKPSFSWINPLDITSVHALAVGLIGAIFIYWGWDTTVSVNEETEDSTTTPGRAALLSTVILLSIYVVVSIAAQAFHGTSFLNNNPDDVLGALAHGVMGSPWDKLLVIAVLTSASASTQTTILPTARTSLSMASHGAIPRMFAKVHPKHLTPSTSTIWMGAASIIWYVGLTILSTNILNASILSLGLMIAFYYGLTGIACPIYYRHHLFTSAKSFLFIGLAPVLGALILAWAFIYSAQGFFSQAPKWLGIGEIFVIGIGWLLAGVVIMLITQAFLPKFFQKRPTVIDPYVAEHGAVEGLPDTVLE